MGKSSRRAAVRLAAIAGASTVWFFQFASGHESSEEAHVSPEARLLPAAEAKLAMGEGAAAVERYREAFADAGGFEERLALMAPLARALFVNGELASLFDGAAIGNGEGKLDEWERAVIRASGFQFLQDFEIASGELLEIERDEVRPSVWELLRRQAAAWVADVVDVEANLRFARELYRENPSGENHARFVRSLIEGGEKDELTRHVEGRADELAAEAEMWRAFLPGLSRNELIDAVSAPLEKAWEAEVGDIGARFALAELRLFQGRRDDAVRLFWSLFELEETVRPADGMPYFQRLNHFFHNRFAVKNRLGQATGAYGTPMCRNFLFFGLRENFEIADTGAARDAALLYLRELEAMALGGGEFLERVRAALDTVDRPPAQRILAFAGLGAPVWVVEEVEAFIESNRADHAAAEFSLRAMNRYVLSTDKFPELREAMGEAARRVDRNFEEERPAELRQRTNEMRARILSRLGLDDDALAASGSPDPAAEKLQDVYARIGEAAEVGDPAEAERLFREVEGEAAPNVLLYLARLWLERDARRAAELVAEYLEPVFARRGGEELQAPLMWPAGAGYPPPNSFLDEASFETIGDALQAVERTDAWPALMDLLEQRTETEPPETRAGILIVLTTLHWWAGENERAIAAGLSGLEKIDDSEARMLIAHLLGAGKRYGRAGEILTGLLPPASETGEQALRLLFALAVAQEDSEGAARWAAELEGLALNGRERLHVAAGLAEAGLLPLAAEWMENVALDSLSVWDEELFTSVQLRIRLDRGEHVRASSLARMILLGEPPGSIPVRPNPYRLEALNALAITGELDTYREHLRGLLEWAPRSISLHLLLGESADFQWQRGLGDSLEGNEVARQEAVTHFRQAASLEPPLADLHVEVCEWLAARGLLDEAVAQYQELLASDAITALLDSNGLIRVFRRAGRLPLLVDFFEEWQAPEARSMDAFYGLQPTEHILRPLGQNLLETGDREAAIRAWEKGLEINPVGFTEEIRVALAELYSERGEADKLLGLLRDYVEREEPDPHFYSVQPFATPVPRWIGRLNTEPVAEEAPVERLIAWIADAISEEALREQAETWRRESPERFSTAAFSVYLAARFGAEDWRERLEVLESEFATDQGPLKGAWEAAREAVARF